MAALQMSLNAYSVLVLYYSNCSLFQISLLNKARTDLHNLKVYSGYNPLQIDVYIFLNQNQSLHRTIGSDCGMISVSKDRLCLFSYLWEGKQRMV